jgi:hypothetical protein
MAPPSQNQSNAQSQYGQYGQYMGTHPGQTHLHNTIMAAAQQQGIANLGRPIYQTSARWMIDGRVMSMEQFADELFGNDTPEKTMFLLKYSKADT